MAFKRGDIAVVHLSSSKNLMMEYDTLKTRSDSVQVIYSVTRGPLFFSSWYVVQGIGGYEQVVANQLKRRKFLKL